VPAGFVPGRGDIVWLAFDPQTGHEQAGKRPALVISAREYNRRVGLALVCPLTTRVKGYPFEVLLPKGVKAEGAVLSDQVKSLEWRARKAQYFCSVPREVMDEVVARIVALVETNEPA